eukprot:6269901-Prymnesium_polylepis.1
MSPQKTPKLAIPGTGEATDEKKAPAVVSEVRSVAKPASRSTDCMMSASSSVACGREWNASSTAWRKMKTSSSPMPTPTNAAVRLIAEK